MEPLDETTALLPEVNNVDDHDALEQKYHEYNMSLHKVPIMFSLWMGSFLSAVDGTVVANIMNGVAEEFKESDKKQWIATSYLLTNTAFQPLYGKLSDLTGRKFAVLTAHLFFGLGCFLTVFARNVTEFSIARAICGIGGGGINAMSSITMSDICTPKERGIYQGYANIIFGTGQLLGAPLGGFLLDTIGWRLIFAVQVPLLISCSFLGYKNINVKLLHVPPREERFKWANLSRIDIFGSLSLVATISSILFLTSTSMNKYILATTCVVSLAVFMWVELFYAKERIIPFEELNGPFGFSSLITICSSFVVFGEIFRSPIYLQIVQNLSVTRSGLFLIFPSISTAIGSILAGWILRRTKLNLNHCASILILGCMCLQIIGLILACLLISHLDPALPAGQVLVNAFNSNFLNLKPDSTVWAIIYIIASVLVSFGYSGLLVATLVSIVFTVDRSKQGTMTGIFYLWRSIGNVLGASLTLVVYENSLGKLIKSYMFNGDNNTGYDFTKKDYSKLIADSTYLRNGTFPIKIVADLLYQYRNAFLVSYLPNIVLAISGALLAAISLRIFHSSHKTSSQC